MSFAWPQLLWLLLAPAALLAWDLTHRRRRAATAHPKILQAEAGVHSLKLSEFAHASAPVRQSAPRVWLFLGLALAIVALARPQWGKLEEQVFDQSREILLAVDLSRSMLTPDIKPSRLDRAKLLIQSLLEKLEGERVGLVVFSGTAFLQSPLSADYEILREFLPALGPEFLPEGGSNYGALINAAVEAFSTSASADRFLVILSDGEATDEEWRGRIDELKKKGIRVIGLGVGTAGGAMIPDGSGGFVKDERGAVVLSKLESGTLEELARTTNGTYRNASTWLDLAALVEQTIAAGRKGDFVEKNTVRLAERFQWPLALALWCLLVSYYYEFPVRPRVRDVVLPAAGGGRREASGVRQAAATAALVAALMLAFAPTPSAHAAATLAPKSAEKLPAPSTPPTPGASTPSSTPAPTPAKQELSTLGKIVGRLADAKAPAARDWAELSRETVTWGTRLKSEQQAVPEGPVRDALAAVDAGAKLDPKTTDWKKLREELEALLQKPDDQQQQQDQPDKNQDQQNQDQQQQKQDQQKQDPSQQKDQKQQSGQSPDQKDQKQPPPEQNSKQEQKQPPGESAFGDMKQKQEPPPPPPSDTQKVGGEKKDTPPEPVDPSLALPLQKLEQLKNQDSPAQLFQLMEGDRKPAKKSGKDW